MGMDAIGDLHKDSNPKCSSAVSYNISMFWFIDITHGPSPATAVTAP